MQKIRQDMDIGKNLSGLRRTAKLTQEQTVAQMQILGCATSRSVYSKIEANSYSVCISELVALTKIFKCSFDDIFAGLDACDN